MGVYIFLLVLIWVVYMLRGKYLVANEYFFIDKRLRKKTKNTMIIIGSALFIVSAFRATSVGIDTKSYLWAFERLGKSVSDLSLSFLAEDGYTLLEYICKSMGLGFRGVIIFGAAIYIIPVLFIIYKYSENPYLSLFYFVTLDYYCFSMSGMRQCIAIGLCLIAFEMAQKKKLLLYLLLVGVAITFHSTAIVFLPVYFLRYIPLKKKYIYPFIGLGIVCFLFKSQLVSIMQSMSRVYYGNMDTGGIGMYLYLLLPVILACIYSPEWENNSKDAKILTNYMMIIAVIMYPILQFNPTVFRLHYYYSIVIIIFLPTVVRGVRDARIRFLISAFFFSVAIYYFGAYTMQNMGVNPYQFGL